MKQFRGCSRLVYALRTVNAETGAVTYGAVKSLAPVKAISIEVADEHEPVYADNIKQQEVFAATTQTRNFEVTRIAPEVVAELLGYTTVKAGVKNGYATPADASKRPELAIGYALHDGDVDNPCEICWANNAKVVSISKSANTIDAGTGSDGQTVQVAFSAPEEPFTTTSERNLDFYLPVTKEDAALVTKFFSQVVTPDNASEVLA